MSEHELAKSNDNNKLPKVDSKNKVAKVNEKNTSLTHVKKNPLVKAINTGKELCVKATKGLIKVTGGALVTVGNKLKSVDWGKLFITILIAFIKVNSTNESNNKAYYSYTQAKPQTKRTVKQKQVKASKQKCIEEKKNKQIKTKNTKSIKSDKSTKQIAKKKNIEISKNNNLMIEKKDKN